jgi:hypothetical protein
VQDPSYKENFYGQSLERVPTWAAARCYSCKKYVLWVDRTLVFPDADKWNAAAYHAPSDDMPADSRSLFLEAVAVLPHSKRAAAALCRAAMERLVKYVDPEAPKKAKLDERLVRLEKRISSSTIDVLNVLRHVGNTALHGGQDGDESATIYMEDDDETIAETFFVAINVLVDELITKPSRNTALYERLPEGVRKSYEEKAARTTGAGV